METRLIALIIASAVTACSVKHDIPAVKDDPLPYRPVNATEVFHLRNECAKLGDQILVRARSLACRLPKKWQRITIRELIAVMRR